MATTIEVGFARRVDGASVVEALVARGLSAVLTGDGDDIRVEVEPNGGGAADVEHALEMWAVQQHLPFISTPLGDGGYVLHPPAG
jgi:hypothetical protein